MFRALVNRRVFATGLLSVVRTYLNLGTCKQCKFEFNFLFDKKVQKGLCFLPAFYLIMWLMKSPTIIQIQYRRHLVRTLTIIEQRRRRWGGAGASAPPPSFGISVNPIRTKGGRLCPPYFPWPPPHLFGRCGVSDNNFVNKMPQ